MVIAVVSDTHHDNKALLDVLDYIERADVLIHLGDNVRDALYLKERFKGETYFVRGNCDDYTSGPKELLIELSGVRIYATHGHHHSVKLGDIMLLEEAKEKGARIALYGHTHISTVENKDGVWLMNPGSPSLPRINRASIGFIEISENNDIYPYIYNV
ncbi:MAG: YfcE family phosphodiesterase [Clostridiaceae bacterium]